MGDGRVAVRGHAVTDCADALRDLILAGDLLPGEQVRQEEMAREFGISRVPLREALRVLASEGLLAHRPHQGYFVAKLSVEDLGQIDALLGFLEVELMRTVRWPTESAVEALREINRTFVEAGRLGDVVGLNRLNRELHTAIFRLSPAETLPGRDSTVLGPVGAVPAAARRYY